MTAWQRLVGKPKGGGGFPSPAQLNQGTMETTYDSEKNRGAASREEVQDVWYLREGTKGQHGRRTKSGKVLKKVPLFQDNDDVHARMALLSDFASATSGDNDDARRRGGRGALSSTAERHSAMKAEDGTVLTSQQLRQLLAGDPQTAAPYAFQEGLAHGGGARPEALGSTTSGAQLQGIGQDPETRRQGGGGAGRGGGQDDERRVHISLGDDELYLPTPTPRSQLGRDADAKDAIFDVSERRMLRANQRQAETEKKTATNDGEIGIHRYD